MSNFLTEDFLLPNNIAKELYHSVAAKQPIIDYHCHLPPTQIAENHQFKNLTEIWLKGDHYKWRAMRTNGVDERFCTGNASDKDKFNEWAKTVSNTIGNPLFHWTHLELRRPFGITDRVLSSKTADSIWQDCNAMLATPDFSAQSIMKKMNVRMAGTTDDPIDDLSAHKAIAENSDFDVKVFPSWRPDRAFNANAADYAQYIESLGKSADICITKYSQLCDALEKRLDHFQAHGCYISDHALDTVEYEEASEAELNTILTLRLAGKVVSTLQSAQLKTAVLIFLGREYARRGWVQQYHIGALRNTNQRMLSILGPDTGFDSINDGLIAAPLAKLLNALEKTDQLPKTILYCLNPRDNEVLATMCGNFQGVGVGGKVQFGAGWWFNDQKDGMLRQMEQLSQLGLLSRFVGMLTDSRSFLSYTRHEYFRRLLCRLLGQWVADGEAPHDMALLSKMVEDICFNNANNYFNLGLEK